MRFVSETSNKKQPVLILDPQSTRCAIQLEQEIGKSEDIEVFRQKSSPTRLEHFYIIFAINPDWEDTWYRSLGKKTRLVLLYTRDKKKSQSIAHRIDREEVKNVKVVSLTDDYLDEYALEKVLWLAFTRSHKESYLELTVHNAKQAPDPRVPLAVAMRRRSKRYYVVGALLTLAVYCLITILILGASSLLYIGSFAAAQKNPRSGAAGPTTLARGLNTVGRALYRPVRPVLFFFSVGLLPDTLVEMNTQLESLTDSRERINSLSVDIVRLLFIRQKNTQLKQALSSQISALNSEVSKAIELSTVLEQKIPHWNDQTEAVRLAISEQKDILARLRPLPTALETITARNSRSKYLVLFADTNSAKPGGGDLPFFGVLLMSDADVQSFEIYDSRSVDLLRKEPIETTETYKTITGAAEYTLQNALLAADLSENVRPIMQLLDKEANMRNFDGVFLVTDRGLARVLSAYTPVYVPAIRETISPENLMIKYQIAPDKKIFVEELAKELLRRASVTQTKALVPSVIEAFNEKQIVFLSEDPALAKTFDTLYWSGTVPTPRCLIPAFSCTVDYVFPLQSNLGSNPVNRYIEKSMTHQIVIDAAGRIKNTFSMNVRNASLAEIFPGGTYSSYAQIILPSSVQVKRVTAGGELIPNPTIISSTYTIVGFPFELAAQASKEIRIDYELRDTLPATKSIYQLIVQKQIGSANSEVALQILLPPGATISNKNFSPVVKNGQVFYNTVLNADKVFVLEIDNSKK